MPEKNPSEPVQQAALAEKTAEQLRSELDAANAKIVELQAQKAQTTNGEKLIAVKTAKGLTRSQAIAVIQRQKEYNAGPIAEEREAREPGEKVEDRNARKAKIDAKHAARK